jgi:hypothetical protein
MGPERDDALMGVMDAVTPPDCPWASESVAGATAIEKSGAVPVTALTGEICETEVRWDVSPA